MISNHNLDIRVVLTKRLHVAKVVSFQNLNGEGASEVGHVRCLFVGLFWYLSACVQFVSVSFGWVERHTAN